MNIITERPFLLASLDFVSQYSLCFPDFLVFLNYLWSESWPAQELRRNRVARTVFVVQKYVPKNVAVLPDEFITCELQRLGLVEITSSKTNMSSKIDQQIRQARQIIERYITRPQDQARCVKNAVRDFNPQGAKRLAAVFWNGTEPF